MDYRGLSVSHGTLRTCDLIEAFVGFLKNNDHKSQLSNFYEEFPELKGADDLEKLCENHVAFTSDALDYLYDLLNEVAPENYYFGAHPGDGSDFGFWELDD